MNLDERIAILAKAAAAEVQPGMCIGLGSGSTAEAVVRALGERVATGLVLTAVATSARTAEFASEHGISLVSLDDVLGLDLGIDGADEIDPDLNLVKGRGGALLWEKLVAQSCDQFIVVSSTEKLVDHLGTRMPLPVEIIPFGATQTMRRVETLGCKPALRLAGDGSTPYLTDGGHYILDCVTGPIAQPISFAFGLKEITGVIDHGLFIDLATMAMVVDENGEITIMRSGVQNS